MGQEAETTRNQTKPKGELSADAIADTVSEEVLTHSSKSVALLHMALIWKYLTSYAVQTFQGEMKNLPVKILINKNIQVSCICNLEDEKNLKL